jgi:hypothetical protein
MRKAFVVIAVVGLTFAAQASFGQTLLVNRGLPTQNVNQVTGNGWGAQRCNCADGRIDLQDTQDTEYPPNPADCMPGDDFTLPTTASEYNISSLSLWVCAPYGFSFSDMFNSISLYMAPGGPNSSAPPIRYVSTVTSAAAATYPNGQGYLDAPGYSGYPTPIPADYYEPIWQLTFPVNALYAGGSQINFGILSSGKPEPAGGNRAGAGESYFIPFLLVSNSSGGAPMWSADGTTPLCTGLDQVNSEFGQDGAFFCTDALGGSYGDANIQVMGEGLVPGDCIGDGRVDINDLTIVLANYGQTGLAWSQGCVDGDPLGRVDINDLTIVLANYGDTGYTASGPSGIAAVPEPACLVLLGIGAIGLPAFVRRKQTS